MSLHQPRFEKFDLFDALEVVSPFASTLPTPPKWFPCSTVMIPWSSKVAIRALIWVIDLALLDRHLIVIVLNFSIARFVIAMVRMMFLPPTIP